jgi:NTE family protein
MAPKKRINLALQGGGAHGAYAWGVLDAFCEDGRVEIDGLSATSAGAMNASVYAYGMMKGGNDGARTALHDFWFDIAKTAKSFEPMHKGAMDWFTGGFGGLESAATFAMMENFTRTFSPYEFNPMNINPLRDVLSRHVDFEELHACECAKLFISATNVRTNKIKIFKNEDVTVDSIMASACLPMLFQAVEIDGEAYWDGGYMGNPALFPLIYYTDTDDILVLHINPIVRDEVPRRAPDISNRINEISFNSSLLRELRTFELVRRMVEEDWIKPEHRHNFLFDKLCMHAIRADKTLCDLSISSKMSPDWDFLCDLRDRGRAEAQHWLKAHYKDIGKCGTIDLKREFE